MKNVMNKIKEAFLEEEDLSSEEDAFPEEQYPGFNEEEDEEDLGSDEEEEEEEEQFEIDEVINSLFDKLAVDPNRDQLSSEEVEANYDSDVLIIGASESDSEEEGKAPLTEEDLLREKLTTFYGKYLLNEGYKRPGMIIEIEQLFDDIFKEYQEALRRQEELRELNSTELEQKTSPRKTSPRKHHIAEAPIKTKFSINMVPQKDCKLIQHMAEKYGLKMTTLAEGLRKSRNKRTVTLTIGPESKIPDTLLSSLLKKKWKPQKRKFKHSAESEDTSPSHSAQAKKEDTKNKKPFKLPLKTSTTSERTDNEVEKLLCDKILELNSILAQAELSSMVGMSFGAVFKGITHFKKELQAKQDQAARKKYAHEKFVKAAPQFIKGGALAEEGSSIQVISGSPTKVAAPSSAAPSSSTQTSTPPKKTHDPEFGKFISPETKTGANVMRMMMSMGYDFSSPQGLGKENQGMVNPIKVEHKVSNIFTMVSDSSPSSGQQQYESKPKKKMTPAARRMAELEKKKRAQQLVREERHDSNERKKHTKKIKQKEKKEEKRTYRRLLKVKAEECRIAVIEAGHTPVGNVIIL